MKNKHSILKKIIILSLCSPIFLLSCNKDSEINKSNDSNRNNIGLKNIANELNPYDFVGVQHNEALDYYINNLSHCSDYQAYERISDYLFSEYGIVPTISYSSFQEEFLAVDSFVHATLQGDTNYQYYLNVDTLICTMDGFTHLLQSMISDTLLVLPESFATAIKDLENNILHLQRHTPAGASYINEYAQVLAALSIARHSYCYWYLVVNNPDSPWLICEESGEKESSGGGFWKIIRDVVNTVKADVDGFIVETHTPANSGQPQNGGVSIDVSTKKAIEASKKEWKERQNSPIIQ